MLLLGLIALTQTIFLPGILILYFVKIKTQSIIQKYIYIFALSLFANYALVTILVLLKIYVVEVMFSIIVIEAFALTFLLIKKKVVIFSDSSFDQLFIFLKKLIIQNTFSVKFLIVGSLTIILFYFSLFISNIGTIFYFVDTVNNIHWNTWAMDFAHNIFPQQSSHFPQLIPANWSVIYLLIGKTNIHFFPKSFMPLFFFGNLLMFFDLAIDKKKYVYLIGLIIYGLFAPIIYNLVFIADGNSDLPVSFFAFLSFYAYLKRNTDKYDLKEYLIVFLFASTAAGTKLAGFYIFFFMSILCLYHFIHNYKFLSKKDIFILFVSVAFILSTNLFWYLLKPATMAGGLHQPEWIASGYSNILKNALHLVYYNIGLPVVAFFILTILFSLFVKESRYIAIFFVVPPIILWMFKYSADFRNLSFVVPFISYVSAFGLLKMVEILKNSKLNDSFITTFSKDDGFNKKTIWLFILSIIAGLGCFFLISTTYFYQILYSTYSFISKYYFQSNRITYLIDYTFFVHVDYYQKVLAMMFLILSVASLIFLLKIKLRYFFILLIFSAVILNFTVMTKPQIIKHQQNEFYKVDARNYYPRISIIIRSTKLDNKVYTNFKPICTEKIQRDIEFVCLDNKTIADIFNASKNNIKTYFLRLSYLTEQTINEIRGKIMERRFDILYDDGDYLLIHR